MRFARITLVGLFIMLSLVFLLNPGQSVAAGWLQQELTDNLQLQPTNYCQSCHSANDARLEQVTSWSGGIERANISPCPAVKTIGEELYYTERLLLAVDNAFIQLPASTDTTSLESKLSAATQTYSRLLDTPVTSLDAFVSEGQVLRFRIGKIYSQINQMIDSSKQLRILIVAILVTIAIVISLGWGWINSSKFIKGDKNSARKFSLSPKIWLLILVVLVLFALPIFRGSSQEVTEVSEEQQIQQTIIDSASRSAVTADRELSKSWMLARIGAEWHQLDPVSAETSLEEAILSSDEARKNSDVIWGEAKSAQEAAIGEWAVEEKALYITNQLDAMRSRAWGLQLIAEEWVDIDPGRSKEILEKAVSVAENTVGDYHDVDLRSLAVTYAHVDPEKSLDLINAIDSLFIRAWGLREIAAVTGDTKIFDLAGDTARQIGDPIYRAYALREIGNLSKEEKYYQEAIQTLSEVEQKDAALAFAWADLVADTGNKELINQIDASFPSAMVVALFETGQYEAAWNQTEKILDPYEQARAQEVIASFWNNADYASQIKIPVLRDRALRNISSTQGDLALVEEIENVYHQIEALTALGESERAINLAPELADRYPLVKLVELGAEENPDRFIPIVDLMDREVDKAQALRALAVSTGDQELFQRALSMALAARVRGDSLSPSMASLALGLDYIRINPELANQAFNQAFEIARRIVIVYE